MSVRLYIGNVPYKLTADELAAACSALAPVQSIYLPIDKDTGRPRGFGFVEVADEAEADRLMNGLNGQALLGRELVVHPARPREDHPQRPRDGHPSHGSAGRGGRHGGTQSGYGRGGRHTIRP
jgi:cold-inducible RNA-binding protein